MIALLVIGVVFIVLAAIGLTVFTMSNPGRHREP